jgi:hypothetical protein
VEVEESIMVIVFCILFTHCSREDIRVPWRESSGLEATKAKAKTKAKANTNANTRGKEKKLTPNWKPDKQQQQKIRAILFFSL